MTAHIQKNIEDAFQLVIETISNVTGKKLFDNISLGFSKWLGSDIVIIGELKGATVEAISMVKDEKFIDNFSYYLEKTPCEKVI